MNELMAFPKRSAPSVRRILARMRENCGSCATAIMGFLAVICILTFSALLFSQTKPPLQPAASPNAAASGKSLTEAEMARMGSDGLAKYVFENHGCKNCHTMGSDGKLGFTQRGKQVGKGFEGCISLLTSMSVIAQVREADRSTEERHKAARFQQFGCTTCHQITPGKLGLTAYGVKLKSFHVACTDVERILAAQKH